MKKIEFVLISIVILLIGFSVPFLPKVVIWLLAVYYMGYVYFRRDEGGARNPLLVLARTSMGVLLILFPFALMLSVNDDLYKVVLALNVSFFLAIAVYCIAKRVRGRQLAEHGGVLVRSGVLVAVCAFLFFASFGWELKRHVFLVMNQNDPYMKHAVNVAYYSFRAGDAKDKGDCDRSVAAAESMLAEWLEMEKTLHDSLVFGYDITNAYAVLYRAYTCKGRSLISANDHAGALPAFEKAHAYLVPLAEADTGWIKELTWSLRNMAICKVEQGEYEVVDSLIKEAVQNYQKVSATPNARFGSLLYCQARSYAKQGYYGASNKLLRTALKCFGPADTSRDDAFEKTDDLSALAMNHIAEDSIKEALADLKRILEVNGAYDIENCPTLVYYGVCLYKDEEYKGADSVLRSVLKCWDEHTTTGAYQRAQIEYALCLVNTALAKFDTAKAFGEHALMVIKQQLGVNNSHYVSFVTALAHINEITGEYVLAEKQRNEVLTIIQKGHFAKRMELATTLSELADVELTLSKTDLAIKHSDNAISIAGEENYLNSPTAAGLLVTAAYIDYVISAYGLAEKEYENVVRINVGHNMTSNSIHAQALNGLALTRMETGRNKGTDSLFRLSLRIHERIFGMDHPFTATVILNYASYCAREGRLAEAEVGAGKAKEMYTRYYSSSHDAFGDVCAVWGDIENARGRADLALKHYKDALSIYSAKFGPTHRKVVTMMNKLKQRR